MNALNLNQQFTASEYLMIDAANAFGLDKENFSTRIQWCRENLDNLEDFIKSSDDPVMFVKAIVTIRKVQKGGTTGHMVALDSTCSGLQILSALTGCKRGMLLTNLVDPDTRYDAYSEIYAIMLTNIENIECEVTRGEAKEALITCIYGSSAKPKEIFGEESEELAAFYLTVNTELEGAMEYLQDAKDAWQPNTLNHSWGLPDNHVASVNVMEKKKFNIEVDELNHHTFTYIANINKGSIKGISLAANITHSIDGYIVREVIRRCNYNAEAVSFHLRAVRRELQERSVVSVISNTVNALSLVIADNSIDLSEVSNNDLLRYEAMLEEILTLPSFEALCIHDAFLCSPIYSNILRYHYKEVLAELAESDVLSQVFSDIYGEEIHYDQVEGGYTKQEAAALIRQSVYAIC